MALPAWITPGSVCQTAAREPSPSSIASVGASAQLRSHNTQSRAVIRHGREQGCPDPISQVQPQPNRRPAVAMSPNPRGTVGAMRHALIDFSRSNPLAYTLDLVLVPQTVQQGAVRG